MSQDGSFGPYCGLCGESGPLCPGAMRVAEFEAIWSRLGAMTGRSTVRCGQRLCRMCHSKVPLLLSASGTVAQMPLPCGFTGATTSTRGEYHLHFGRIREFKHKRPPPTLGPCPTHLSGGEINFKTKKFSAIFGTQNYIKPRENCQQPKATSKRVGISLAMYGAQTLESQTPLPLRAPSPSLLLNFTVLGITELQPAQTLEGRPRVEAAPVSRGTAPLSHTNEP